MPGIVIEKNVTKYEDIYKKGYDKSYPNLDAVRLEKMFFKGKTGKLLDYGFGTGSTLLHFLNSNYKCFGVEASKEAIKLVSNKLKSLNKKATLELIKEDEVRLPFENESFDYIICLSVLSLLGSKDKIEILLKEFERILKSGGKMIVDINGPEAGFVSKGRFVSEDTFEYVLRKNQKPITCYCPKSAEVFKSFLNNYFEVIDMGTVFFKYFDLENHEFIACAIKG